VRKVLENGLPGEELYGFTAAAGLPKNHTGGAWGQREEAPRQRTA
jgi:hypothetical protein